MKPTPSPLLCALLAAAAPCGLAVGCGSARSGASATADAPSGSASEGIVWNGRGLTNT
jgi:hypothetical protein